MNPVIYPGGWLDKNGVEYGATEYDGTLYVISRLGSGHRVTATTPWETDTETVTEGRLRRWLNGGHALRDRGVATGAMLLSDWITSDWGRARWADLLTGSGTLALNHREMTVVRHLRKQQHDKEECDLCIARFVATTFARTQR